MDKKSFLNIFQNEDPMVISKLFEDINKAWDGNFIIGSAFLTPNIWKKIYQDEYIIPKESGFYGFSDGERKIFSNPVNIAESSIVLLSMENLYPRNKLQHKDYLGALMSLSIDRSKFSDLIIYENKAYFLTLQEISGYIIENLDKAGRNGLRINVENKDLLDTLKIQKEKLNILLTSNRADVLVSELTNLSRTKSEDLILKGNLLINNNVVKEKSFEIKIKDFITIRGFGKFIIDEYVGENKKGKKKINVYKYST